VEDWNIRKLEQHEISYRLLSFWSAILLKICLVWNFWKISFLSSRIAKLNKRILPMGATIVVSLMHIFEPFWSFIPIPCHLSNCCTLQMHLTPVKKQHSLQICASPQPIWSSVDLSDVDIYPGILDIVQDKAVIFTRKLWNQCRDFLLVAFCEDPWYTCEMEVKG
jgi:hypothetical protein